jgi:hypothetical protein
MHQSNASSSNINNTDMDRITHNSPWVAQRQSEDPVICLSIPYADPYNRGFAKVYTNKKFWDSVCHKKWVVMKYRNHYCVSEHEHKGFSNPMYLHIECVRFYEDEGVFGSRRLPSSVVSEGRGQEKRKRTYTVDHIVSNRTLDNSIGNLRIANGSEQSQNRAKKRYTRVGQPCSSRYKGVSKSMRTRKDGSVCVRYNVDFRFGDISKRPGGFKTEIGAAKAYNELCMKYCPSFAQLNIIPEEATSNSDEDGHDEVDFSSSGPDTSTE